MSEQENSIKKTAKVMVFILAFSVTGLGGVGIVFFGGTLFFGATSIITGAAGVLTGGLSASKDIFNVFESIAKTSSREKAYKKEQERREAEAAMAEEEEQKLARELEALALEAEEAAAREEEERLARELERLAMAEAMALEAEEMAGEAEEAEEQEPEEKTVTKKTAAEAKKAAREKDKKATQKEPAKQKEPPKQKEPQAEAKQETPGQIYKTGFNCNTAKATAAKTVCTNKELADMDVEMVSLYKPLADKLEEDQKNWLRKRNKCEDNVACLKNEYKARIKFLKDNS